MVASYFNTAYTVHSVGINLQNQPRVNWDTVYIGDAQNVIPRCLGTPWVPSSGNLLTSKVVFSKWSVVCDTVTHLLTVFYKYLSSWLILFLTSVCMLLATRFFRLLCLCVHR